MAEELVIPPYQVDLIRHKPLFGVELSNEEQELVASVPERPLNEFLQYLQSTYPKRFEKIVVNTSVRPINNYRENYKAAMLLTKAYSAGLFQGFSLTEEQKNFKSKYRMYRFCENLYFYGGLASFLAFNFVLTVPRFGCWPSFIWQNTGFLATWWLAMEPLRESSRRQMLPCLDLAARQNKSELFKLHKENKLIYQYQEVLEDFPPNEFTSKNWGFLRDAKAYEKAHKNDFNGINRRKSQFMHYKENQRRLI